MSWTTENLQKHKFDMKLLSPKLSQSNSLAAFNIWGFEWEKPDWLIVVLVKPRSASSHLQPQSAQPNMFNS